MLPEPASRRSCDAPLLCRAVKVAAAEAQIPAFDLGRKVGRKIAATPHRRAVVACVVDLADFDGSLPRAALAACIPRGAPSPPLPHRAAHPAVSEE